MLGKLQRPSCNFQKSSSLKIQGPELSYLVYIIIIPIILSLMGIWPNSTEIVPGWSPTKIVQMALIGCISRSRGQKIGYQNAIFKNLLVWNYTDQIFHIWHITPSRGPLPKLFKLNPWGHILPPSQGSQIELYKESYFLNISGPL